MSTTIISSDALVAQSIPSVLDHVKISFVEENLAPLIEHNWPFSGDQIARLRKADNFYRVNGKLWN